MRRSITEELRGLTLTGDAMAKHETSIELNDRRKKKSPTILDLAIAMLPTLDHEEEETMELSCA